MAFVIHGVSDLVKWSVIKMCMEDEDKIVELVEENARLKKQIEFLTSQKCSCFKRYEVVPNLDENFVGIWDDEIEEFIKTMSINGNSPYTFKEAREELNDECSELNHNWMCNV